jgi:hypothetical protein
LAKPLATTAVVGVAAAVGCGVGVLVGAGVKVNVGAAAATAFVLSSGRGVFCALTEGKPLVGVAVGKIITATLLFVGVASTVGVSVGAGSGVAVGSSVGVSVGGTVGAGVGVSVGSNPAAASWRLVPREALSTALASDPAIGVITTNAAGST